MRRGILAGAISAAVWAAAEPALGRVFRTPYSDVRLLGGLTGRRSRGGLALHVVNGAVFGAVFERTGGRGVLRGVLAAEAENLLLWPLMAVIDRVHPERRAGAWPPLFGNARVFAYEATVHALFGALLGSLVKPSETASRSRASAR
ncbi:MAG TPA: hypothetical protein VE693_11235 [Gaiellaceae bacterium]|nr:hypothetical protein [Gaiellaceae bacterium]